MTDEIAPVRHAGTSLEHSVPAVCTGAALLFGRFPGLLFDPVGSILP
ncbi:MAG: hypothetical protein IMY82_08755 [Chloroflexi bacterium]|nr:hypothetical protein [Chloroflexota bacterium]